MNEIVLRRLSVEDVPALSILAKKTFYDSFTGTCTPADMDDFLDSYYNETILAEEINDSEMNYFFAEIDGEVTGYILFKENNPLFEETKNKKTIELKRLYVLSNSHGKGVAQKMMNYFLEYSEKMECDIVFLGVWEYNCRAQYFYAKYGFIQTLHKHNFPIGNTPQQDIYLIKNIKATL
jgi:diamine N-acetyltransferase